MTFTLRDDLTRNSRKILRETIYRFGKYIFKIQHKNFTVF
jgi:hypothetical protein